MDKALIEKYKQEMMNLYRKTTPKSVAAQNTVNLPQSQADNDSGGLAAVVTAIGSLFPVSGAEVTVFTGSIENPVNLKTVIADQSGKTETVLLPTPPASLSLTPDSATPPYTLYNMRIKANGYADNIHLNIPVFRGIKSVQSSNLTPSASAGDNGPIVYNELSSYSL